MLVYFFADPVSMAAPVILPLSSVALNVTWEEPGVRDVLGVVQEYHVYQLQRADPALSPFAPAEQWMVSLCGGEHCCLLPW